MKRTTIALDDEILRLVKTKAAHEDRTMNDCVNDLIRLGLKAGKEFNEKKLPPLPTSNLGKTSADLSSRSAFYSEEDARMRIPGMRRRNL